MAITKRFIGSRVFTGAGSLGERERQDKARIGAEM